MGRDDENGGKRDRRKSISESEPDPDSDSDSEEESSRKSHRRRSSSSSKTSKTLTSKRKRYRDSSSESYDSDSDSYYSDSDSDSRRRRRKDRKRKDEKRRREKEKEKKRKREKEKKKNKEKKKKDKAKKGAVTSSWGKYGIIKETDMWNKRPEFTAWLGEVKKVNLESLPNWEEKQLFKDFMEDHNTATFPSRKYYNLDAYYQRKLEKDMKKGVSMVQASERTIFNDEEIRRLEMQREREKQKEQEVEALKRSMQSGMAQAMKEQAQLREEMAYQYKLGNFEAAAAIQRRLDPDVPT